ncbi:Protein of unknown function [Bradyrhizobium sp. Rc2d]|uniref:lysozyme inhibitor LprI family protein n=1 Tax=Bradyrhizobium sp. Rc2d TaxID=1855321 RepID=UPI00088EA790|nr:lysozyme inhibitor LprI family protein [Bradyrhizobium sp. Rc2d]SDG70380.1 Protein of unknown function [Bradyrhizobium sp. Rc2d]
MKLFRVLQMSFAALAVCWTGLCNAAGYVFELPNSDPIRSSTRALGALKFSYDINPKMTSTCPAVVISQQHILVDYVCASIIENGDAFGRAVSATLHLGVEDYSIFTRPTPGIRSGVISVSEKKEHLFAVNVTAVVEKNEKHKFGILEVYGNPAATFGIIPVSSRPVRVGEELSLITGFGSPIHDCKADMASGSQPYRFSYHCDVAMKDASFIFAKDGSGLVGIHMTGDSESAATSQAIIEAPHTTYTRATFAAFKCKQPAALIERIVCSDDQLRELDSRMTTAYFARVKSIPTNSSQRGTVLQEQDAWLVSRTKQCRLPDDGKLTVEDSLRARHCLLNIYTSRIQTLYAAIDAPSPSVSCVNPNYLLARIVCGDSALKELNGKLNALHWRFVEGIRRGEDRFYPSFVTAHSSWVRSLRARCRVDLNRDSSFNDTSIDATLYARNCLVREYKDRIARLTANSSSGSIDRLDDRPAAITENTSYFAVVKAFGSSADAQTYLNQLMTKFPFQRFSLFPPHSMGQQWMIVLASYTDSNRATEIVDEARKNGMASDAYVWKIPASFNVPDNWVAQDIHRTILRCLVDGAQTIMQMYSCSGSVVTPGILLTCIKGGTCELNATSLGANETLRSQKLTWSSPLVVTRDSLDLKIVNDCLATHSKDERGFKACAVGALLKGNSASKCGDTSRSQKTLRTVS